MKSTRNNESEEYDNNDDLNIAPPPPPPQIANPANKKERDSELQWLVIDLILVFIINQFIRLYCVFRLLLQL
jgi:hypothetical protein